MTEDARRDILSPKNDFVFKQLFGNPAHSAPLAAFLRSVLPLPEEEFESLVFVDPHLKRKFGDDKPCVLDVRVLTRSRHDVDVEIQVARTPDLLERLLVYLSKMAAEKLRPGDSYKKTTKSICIAIVDHRLWEDGRYRHRFRLHDPEAGIEYPDLLEIHTLELPKLPAENDGTALWRWLRFVASETRDEFASLAREDTVMAETVGRLLELSADEITRLRAEARDKWLFDQASRERHSREEGRREGELEIVRRMLRAKVSFRDIADFTGCPMPEIMRLAEEER